MAAARSAATLASGVAATTTAATTTTTGGTVTALSAARTATTLASGVAATTVATTTASTTTTTTAAAGSLAAARTATTVATSAVAGTGLATTRAATTVGSTVAAVASSTGTTTSTTTATATAIGSSRVFPFFASGSTVAAKKASVLASGRAVGAGMTATAAADSFMDGAAAGTAVDAVTSSAGSGLGEALAGAGTEMVGDAATLVGDAVMDGVSAVGSAVADAAVGVATDAAIGSGTVWGVWDGIQRILPSWLFTGGAVVVGGEVAFALFAFYVASQTASSLAIDDENSAGVEESTRMQDSLDEGMLAVMSSTPVDIVSTLAEVEAALQDAENTLSPPFIESSLTSSRDEELFQRALLEASFLYNNNLYKERKMNDHAPSWRTSEARDMLYNDLMNGVISVEFQNTPSPKAIYEQYYKDKPEFKIWEHEQFASRLRSLQKQVKRKKELQI